MKEIKKVAAFALVLLLSPLALQANEDSFFHAYHGGDYLKAKIDLKQAAEKNNKKALFYLGKMYLKGYGVKRDNTEGLRLMKRSALLDYLPAQEYLGKYYLHNQQNIKEAIVWFSKAATLGNLNAQRFCANAYLHGYGVGKNSNRAKKYLILAAKNNDASSQYELGLLFLDSQYESNRKLGVIWIKKAANNEKADKKIIEKAQYKLGILYSSGKSIKRDEKRAIFWLSRSAKGGNFESAYLLAKYYQTLPNSNANINEAFKWYQMGAKNSKKKAQFQLGLIYLNSDYANHNVALAFQWIQKAANQDNPQAQYQLATMFDKGIGTKKNSTKAFEWYLKAARDNLVNAKRQVGVRYYEGVGVDRDRSEGARWLVEAQKEGDLLSKYTLDSLRAEWDHHLNNDKSDSNKNDTRDQNEDKGSFTKHPQLLKIMRSELFTPSIKIINPSKTALSDLVRSEATLNYKKRKVVLTPPRYQLTKNEYIQKHYDKLLTESHHGNMNAQFKLGQVFEYGLGREKNFDSAAAWYLKSSNQGYSRAEYQLGLLFLEGKGDTKIKDKNKIALQWIEKAALKGDRYAQYMLGVIYENGYGKRKDSDYIPKNIYSAISMYNLAAHSKFDKAEVNLAQIYSSGIMDRAYTSSNHSTENINNRIDYHKKAIQLYKSAAIQGNSAAEISLAYYYAVSNPKQMIPPNAKNLYKRSSKISKQEWAFRIAKKRSKQGNQRAELLLAMLYDKGVATPKNRAKALSIYLNLARKNNPMAQYILGSYYALGDGVAKNRSKSIQWLSKSARQGFPNAEYNLAIEKNEAYAKDNATDSIKKKYSTGFLKLLNQSAQQKYSPAQFLLANIYLHDASKLLAAKAFAIYKNLAKSNNPNAQLRLGFLFEHGIATSKNYQKANYWYISAATHGNVQAQYLLGRLHQMGRGTPHNITTALYWYKKAAQQDYMPAQVAIGFIYETDKINYAKAKEWYMQAAKNGSPQGAYNLGLLFEYGKGVEVNYLKAFAWYYKAAEKNLSQAEYSLGELYIKGLGVKRNSEKALNWFKKAAVQGDYYARLKLESIKKKP